MTRIIAGAAKGRRVATPTGSRTRPTTDRVREAVFSVIASWAGTLGEPAASQLDGLAFLDLFAGSGAVGLEAASRGASPVWAVESDPATARLIRRNAAGFGLPVSVLARGAEAVVGGRPSVFNSVSDAVSPRSGPAPRVSSDSLSSDSVPSDLGSFDIVWADPPYVYDDDKLDALLVSLVGNGWLAAQALVVVERSSRGRAPRWPPGLEVLPVRGYGETSVHFATKGGA